MTLEGMLIELREQPSKPHPRQWICFHGTRCPTKILQTKGLVFDADWLNQKLKEFAKEIGIDFEAWTESKRGGCLSGYSMMAKLKNESWRTHVWVASNPRHVKGFAERNPEFLWESIESMMVFKHPRRLSKKFWREEIPQMQRRLIGRIGTPKIVTIDLRKLREEGFGKYHTNIPLKSPIPPEAILKIKEIQSNG